MKQKLLICFALLLIGICSKVQAYDFSAVAPSGQTLYYNVTSTSLNTVEVTSKNTTYPYYSSYPTGTLTIPSIVTNGGTTYSVTSIGNYAFYGCSGLTSITIPNSVTSIGSTAFGYCGGLTSITIPNSVTSIGSSAFKYCGGLTSITIPNSVTSIGDASFSDCISLTSITIPNSVTAIGDGAFSHCLGLISVTMPNSIISIGNGAFAYDSNMTAISIPNSVISIGNYAFKECKGLTSVTIGSYVNSIGDGAFSFCYRVDSITIPNTVTSIGYSVFSNCSGLTSVTIQNSVTSIGNYAFSNCSGLTSVTIGSSVTSIGNYAFSNCSGLNSIICKAIIPPSIGGYDTFNGVSKLNTTVYVPCSSKSSYQSKTGWSSFFNFVGEKTANFITTSICQGQQYTNYGANIDSAGVYTLVNGCDSVILNLSVNPSYNIVYTDTICAGQVYNNYGFNINANAAGKFIHKINTIKGCDSITLNLVVNPIYNYTINASICKGQRYMLNGFDTDTAGLFTQNLQTIKGCDSIVKLNLKVNPIYNDTLTASICQGETYTLYGFNRNSSGIYTKSLQTQNTGCDSTITLNLTVNPIYNDTIKASICQGQVYNENGFNADSIGVYTQHLQTINSCDSIVTLILNVVNPPKQDIDMVTVDNNNHNVILWNKNEVVNHYNIYKEGNVLNQYDLIATVPYNSTSIFVDTNSNPTIKAYMYKISTTDTCLNESELSSFHKTMHLTISQGIGNNWNLYWSPYEGAYYTTYNIYRGLNSLDSLEYLTTISSSNTSYTDINVPSQIVYYQIEIIKDTNTTNKYSIQSIRSNIVTNYTSSLDDIRLSNITTKLYPNPSNGKAKFEVEGLDVEADVLVYDMLGKVVLKLKINQGEKELDIDLNGYAKGVYTIRIMNDGVNQTKKLIVQ